MEDKELKIQRLCSEIQLFDLCSEEACTHREGRFCTNGDLLAKFEAISEDEPDMYLAEDGDDEPESADELDDDAFDADGYGDEDTDEEY